MLVPADATARVVHALSRLVPWAVGVFYVLAISGEAGSSAEALAGLAIAVGMGVALARRHDRPEATMAATVVLSVAAHALAPEIVVPFAGLVAVWALARLRPPKASLVGLAALLAVIALNFLTGPAGDAVFTMAVAVTVWALGESARNRHAAIAEAARRAALDEQARIARELHDVIAHSVSVIVVQAAAAGDVFDASPEQARASLASIESTGREALAELRRLLGAVRPAPTGPHPEPPQAGLERVEALAAPLRAAGLDVVVTRHGSAAAVPAGVDVSAYRIVQEALTNTLRHARASVAEVTLRYTSDAVELEVVDDGRGSGAAAVPGRGLGLLGMRERAGALGGTCEAGPTAHGGYRVRARLPIGPVP